MPERYPVDWRVADAGYIEKTTPASDPTVLVVPLVNDRHLTRARISLVARTRQFFAT